MNKLLKNKKGSALVEYGLLIAGVALVGAAAVSIFGHKTTDLIGATATVLAPADSDELRAAFESLQLAMLPLRNDVAARLGTRDSA